MKRKKLAVVAIASVATFASVAAIAALAAAATIVTTATTEAKVTIATTDTMNQNQLDGRNRSHIKVGQEVAIVQKQDQRTGDLTEGFVKRILTKSAKHPHGIKVQLETGEVGRVKKIFEE